MLLKDQTALITGAGRGIGRAIALRLAAEGAGVIIGDADPETAALTAEEITAGGGRAAFMAVDVSRAEEAQSLVQTTIKALGGLDIVINNAGIGGSSRLVRDMDPDDWARTLAVNLTGVFNCCRAAAPHLIDQGRGKIVNIASLAARRMSKLGGADYTASKYGVIGLSKHLAFELAAFGINVNVVCPGPTLTELVKEKTTEEFRAQIDEQVPLGRWIRPEEQAEAVLFLVGPGSDMITGHVLDVEGGQLLGIAADYRDDLARRTEISRMNQPK